MRRSTLAPEIDPASEFEVFFELEHGRLHHAVYMATGSRTDADDRAHEALLHAWERWERVRIMHRPSLFVIRRAMNPLRAVLSGRWVAHRRRFRHEPTLEPFEDVRLDDETRGMVLDLSRDQRSSLSLVRSLDLSPGEAGRALGRRAASIRGDVGTAERLVRDRRVASPISDLDDDDPVLDLLEKVRRACAPDPGAFDRHLAMRARAVRRRRASTVAAVAVVTAIVALAVGRGSQPDPPSGPPGVVPPPTDLAARHQLPGLLMAASVDVPGGWRVDGSIWGSGGVGVRRALDRPARQHGERRRLRPHPAEPVRPGHRRDGGPHRRRSDAMVRSVRSSIRPTGAPTAGGASLASRRGSTPGRHCRGSRPMLPLGARSTSPSSWSTDALAHCCRSEERGPGRRRPCSRRSARGRSSSARGSATASGRRLRMSPWRERC